MTVRSYMSTEVHAVDEQVPLAEVERELARHRVSSFPVLSSDRRLSGVISRADLLRLGQVPRGRESSDEHLLELPEGPVGQVMATQPVCVGPDTPLPEAAARMREHHVHRLYVQEAGELIGVLSAVDLMRAVAERRVQVSLGELMTPGVIAVGEDDSLATVAQRMQEHDLRRVVVVQDGWPVGVVSQQELLSSRHLPRGLPVREVMSRKLLSLPPTMRAHHAAAQALEIDCRLILVVGPSTIAGVVTDIDLAAAIEVS